MEKRINKKIETYISEFKDRIKDKATDLGLSTDSNLGNLVQYIYDYDRLCFSKEDFQKKYPETVVKYYFKLNKYMKSEEEDLRDIIKVKIIEIMFQYVLDM